MLWRKVTGLFLSTFIMAGSVYAEDLLMISCSFQIVNRRTGESSEIYSARASGYEEDDLRREASAEAYDKCFSALERWGADESHRCDFVTCRRL